MRQLDLLVIVVTYNSHDVIRSCLDSISNLNSSDLNYKVLVIDNNSDVPIKKYLEGENYEFDIEKISLNENIGFGRANNVAFAFKESRYYLLLNPDAQIVSDISVLSALELMNADQSIAIVGLPLIYEDGSPQSNAFYDIRLTRWVLSCLGIVNVFRPLMHHPLIRRSVALIPVLGTLRRRIRCQR